MMNNFSTTDYTLPAQQPQTLVSIIPDFILADVVFGSPREDCAGTGICRIEALAASPAAAGPRECRRARATLSSSDAHSLVLCFRRSDLCSHLFRHYFRNDHFCLPQGCSLPGELAQSMQLAYNELIPGNYPIAQSGDLFRITLKVG